MYMSSEENVMKAVLWLLRTGCIDYDGNFLNERNLQTVEKFRKIHGDKARYRFITQICEDDSSVGSIECLNVYDTVKQTYVEFGLFALEAYDKGSDTFDDEILRATYSMSLVESDEVGHIYFGKNNVIRSSHESIIKRCRDTINGAIQRYGYNKNTDEAYMELPLEMIDEDLLNIAKGESKECVFSINNATYLVVFGNDNVVEHVLKKIR